MSEREGFWSRLARLFSRRDPALDRKPKPDLEIVDPFERFEAAIRKDFESSE